MVNVIQSTMESSRAGYDMSYDHGKNLISRENDDMNIELPSDMMQQLGAENSFTPVWPCFRSTDQRIGLRFYHSSQIKDIALFNQSILFSDMVSFHLRS